MNNIGIATQQQNIAYKQAIDNNIFATDATTSGNMRSSPTIVEIMLVMFFYIMRYRIFGPRNLSSNGGSGQNLALAANMAYTAKYSDQAPDRVFCLLEEEEAADNIVWQILTFIGNYQLDNMVVIINVKWVAQSDPILFQNKLKAYGALLEKKGFYSVIVNGDVTQLIRGYNETASSSGKPIVVVATVSEMRLDQLPVYRGPPTIEMPADPTMGLNPNAKGFCYIRVGPNTDIVNLEDDLLQTGDAKVICHVEKDEVVVAGAALTLDEVLSLSELQQHPTRIAVTNPSKITSLEAILKKMSSVTGTTSQGGNNQSSEDTIEALCLAATVSYGTDYEYEFAKGVPRSGAQRSYVDKRGICAAYVF